MDPFAARRNQSSWDCSSSAYSGKRSYEALVDVAQNSYDYPTCSSAGDLAEQLDNIMNFNEFLPPKHKRRRTTAEKILGPATGEIEPVAVELDEKNEMDISRPPGTWHVSDEGLAATNAASPQEQPRFDIHSQPSPLRQHEKSQRRQQCGQGNGLRSSMPNGEKEVPHATEEEWTRRAEKRSDPVNNVKASLVYRDNQDYTPRPHTPNPCKRISKRDWETEVAEWRSEWRAIDGVRKLVDMGFERIASGIAWRESKLHDKSAHDQEAQLDRAIALLTTASEA